MDSHKALEAGEKQMTSKMAMDIAEVVQGFLQGANLGTFNFTTLLECIMVADKTAIFAYNDVELAMDAWKKKDWQEAFGAALTAVAVYQGVEQSVGICEQVDLKKKMTINPLAFAKAEVQAKLNDAIVAHDAGKLHEFGKDIGQAISFAEEKNLFVF